MEQGIIARKVKNKKLMQEIYSNFEIIKPATGAITNCPIDRPASTRPKAIPAILGSTNGFTEAKTTGKLAKPKPIEEITSSFMERFMDLTKGE